MYNCYYEIAKQLLEAGADVNFSDKNSNKWATHAAIMIPVYYNQPSMMELLLYHGAHPLVTSNCQEELQALFDASADGRFDAILLDCDKTLPGRGLEKPWSTLQHGSPLAAATYYNHYSPMERLLHECVNQDLRLPLCFFFYLALAHDHPTFHKEECVIMVSRQGYIPAQKPSKKYASCFHKASHLGYGKLMCLLMEMNPQFLQEEWLVQKQYPLRLTTETCPDFLSNLDKYRKQPVNLQQLCRSTILTQLSPYNILKIKDLALPQRLKAFLGDFDLERMPLLVSLQAYQSQNL